MKFKGMYLLLLLLVGALLCAPVFAQDATGKVVGIVHDQQGAVIPSAKVTVTNVGTGVSHSLVSDTNGAYQALNLPIGQYRVAAEREGFQKVVTAPYSLEINATLKVDVTLPVGTANEVVEVSGTASLVETQNATMGNSVTSRPIVDLPLNGRNVLDLAVLEAGVTMTAPADNSHPNPSFSVGGGRTDSITFLLDGGTNNNLLDNSVVYNPNPDSIAEFRILESNYNAEYGRNAGGVISVVTKSGTNNIHGTGFDFLRNDALDANSFFNKVDGLPKESLHRNQFGGTIGGPIIKDKAFFFGSYEGQRWTESVHPDLGSYSTFTPSMLQGDFSQTKWKDDVASFLANNPYYQPDAALAQQGIIATDRIDPIAKAYIQAGLIPSSTTGVVTSQATQKSNFDEYTGKFDYNFTANDRLSATFGYTTAPGTRPFTEASVPFPVNDNAHTYFLNAAYNKTITSNLLNELRFTAQRFNQQQGYPATKLPSGPELGVKITPDLQAGPPILYFNDSGLDLGFSYRGPVDKVNNTFGVNEVLSWVKGKHTMKMGFGASGYQNNTLYAYEVNGEFDFYGSTTGSEFADFLLGAPDEYYQSSNAPSNVRSKSFLGFWQDEWHVSPRLTLSYGLRYEYSSPKYDTQGRSFSFNWGQQSTVFPGAPLGLVFPGDPGVPNGANFPDKNDFAPRIGFAYDPTGTGKTSIRGGFGVFYDVLKAEDNLQFNGQAPWNGFADILFDPWTSTGASPYMQDPFGSTGTVNTFPSHAPDHNMNFLDAGFLPFGGGSVYWVDPHLRTPYVYQYNLSVQREIARDLRVDIAYVGSTSHKLTALQDSNPMILGTTTRIRNTQSPDMYASSFSYMDTFKNLGYQNYNSLQTSLKKQMSGQGSKWGASYFTLAYTWSKDIDTSSGFRTNNGYVKVGDPGADRAVSDIDVSHNVVFSAGWDLPFQELLGGPSKLTKGWTFNPIVNIRSGFPIDIRGFLKRSRTSAGPSGYGDNNLVRANLVGNSVQTFDPHDNVTTDGALYFSPDNFNTDYPDGTYTYGTLPRNFFRGPGYFNVNASLTKLTSINERFQLEFRTEFFNLFNHAQFENPSNLKPDSDLFGRITSTYLPRQIQFGAKLIF